MALETGDLISLPTSPQSNCQKAQEEEITLHVHNLHQQIGSNQFSKEISSRLSLHFSTLSNSNNIEYQVLKRYMMSFGETEYYRFLNEIEICKQIGKVSVFFLMPQELNYSTVAELPRLMWLDRGMPRGPVALNENLAVGLLDTMNHFKPQFGFRNWTRDIFGDLSFSSKCISAECQWKSWDAEIEFGKRRTS
jgi:hypothetical protein